MKNKKMKTYNRPEIQVIVADSVLLSADSGNGPGEAKHGTALQTMTMTVFGPSRRVFGTNNT